MGGENKSIENEIFNPAISMKNISLTYSLIRSMDIKSEILKIIQMKKRRKKLQIEALKNICLTVNEGEIIGIIGQNGAGKSTLLKVIANIFEPDSGEVHLNDKSVFLMSLGAGFQNELSGLDNIYLNALLLGLSKSEVKDKIHEIIEFAELEESINNPLKSYSTGMKSRLAFSIACNINAEVLLIDEVLSVGDEAFKAKSKKRMIDLIESGRTVVIVSHNLGLIQQICTKTLWMHKGEIIEFGDSKKVVKEYREFIKAQKEKNQQ